MSQTKVYICKHLSMNDINRAIAECPIDKKPGFSLLAKERRNKDAMVQKLLETGPYWANFLLTMANNVSKAREDALKKVNEERAKQRKSSRKEQLYDTSEYNYLDLPTQEEYLWCYSNFFNATTNESLAKSICAVCARRLNTRTHGFAQIPLRSIPNPGRLKPQSKSVSAQQLRGGCLLEAAGCFMIGSEEWISICSECNGDLKKALAVPPKYSLANNLWIGTIPEALKRLSFGEHLLIALVYPRAFVVKLFPKDIRAYNLPESQRQSALRGNVTSFELSSEAMSDMLSGKLTAGGSPVIMPQSLDVLSNVLSITFVGRGRIPQHALNIFRVRRDRVWAALIWLKENNKKYYGNININNSRLLALPLDDVPDQIKINVRQEEDVSIINAESNGYVPLSGVPNLEEEGKIISLPSCNKTKSVAIDLTSISTGDEDMHEDPSVIPLQYLGVMDNNASKITTSDVLHSALTNLLEQDPDAEYYAVRYGAPANTFGQPPVGQTADPNRGNYWERAFPLLYPYGVGGIEADRPVKLSFIEHIRWSLCHHDRRFRYHETFPFVAFGIYQRRQVMRSAKLLAQRKEFASVSRIIRGITHQDLLKAKHEEEQKQRFSNPAIGKLMKQVRILASKVLGSNSARSQLRSRIVSTSLYLGPPTLWMTINPDDINDPIAQILAGVDIDLVQFLRTSGPSPAARAENIAKDPFAAAEFFSVTISTLLAKLFGISVTSSRVYSDIGVLGRVQAYFGTVECQGRGTLHLHLLLWMHGSPPPIKMKEMLQTPEFRLKVASYLKANVRTYHPQMHSPCDLELIPTSPQVAYSRPPDPLLPLDDFLSEFSQLELEVVRTKQMHKCDDRKCQRFDKYGRKHCKRRAPWELSEHDTVNSDGTFSTKRTLGYLNGFCPSLAVATRANHDIKLLTYGSKVSGIEFYVTKYMVKGEARSHNTSALLANGLAYYYDQSIEATKLRKNQDDLIQKAFNVLNREQEVPAPMVVTHLMGFGDSYTSHQYSNIFLSAFISSLYDTYSELKDYSSFDQANLLPEQNNPTHATENHAEMVNSDESVDNMETANGEELIMIQVDIEGKPRFTSQVDDYIHRGKDAEAYNVMDYFVGTYEAKISNKSGNSLPSELDNLAPACEPESHAPKASQQAHSARRGRPSHQRIHYTIQHPKHATHHRVVRPSHHNSLPNFIGAQFPRGTDPDQTERHAAWILVVFKPWRAMKELKHQNQSWADALTEFTKTCNRRINDIIENIEHFHSCKTAAEGDNIESSRLMDIDDEIEEHIDTPSGDNVISSNSITPEMVDEVKKAALNPREMAHGRQAVWIGQNKGLFATTPIPITQRATVASMDGGEFEQLREWQDSLEKGLVTTTDSPEDVANQQNQLAEIVTVNSVRNMFKEGTVEMIPTPIHEESILPAAVAELNQEQKRAFGIVQQHLTQYLRASRDSNLNPPEQLLMVLTGQGGTGKSRVIQTLTQDFKERGCSGLLLKSAFTGIAASLIDGKTTHHIANISVRNKNQTFSPGAKKKLATIWRGVEYLIIDEYSMISKEFLAKLSRHISIAKLECNEGVENLPFGGVNTVLCGDLHQFPPVASSSNGALFHPTDLSREDPNHDRSIGRAIYERFRTVVTLNQQIRAKDTEWRAFLDRLRHGNVTDEDLVVLKSLTLTDASCRPTNFSSPLWQEACLITPRHAVRTQWNELSVRRHCQSTGAQLYVCPAEDLIQGKTGKRPLSLHEQYCSAQSSGLKKGLGSRNGLPDEIFIALGLKVMVTLNVETDLDVANGARGTIVGIVLAQNEPPFEADSREVTLSAPPAYVLVKMDRTRAVKLTGLDNGVIPIVPVMKTYSFKVMNKQKTGEEKVLKKNVLRRQLPITPAYAFTDYRSQGQTIPAAIVDIATPPTGSGLTLANVYVALSRCSGTDNIRILREFDEQILLKPVDYDLAREDRRLEALSTQTKGEWEKLRTNLH